MKFRARPFIDIDVRKRDDAVRFYRDVLGFEFANGVPAKDAERVEIRNGLVTLALRESLDGHTAIEFCVDNLHDASTLLAKEGCEIYITSERNRLIVKDPFGNHFNIVEV